MKFLNNMLPAEEQANDTNRTKARRTKRQVKRFKSPDVKKMFGLQFGKSVYYFESTEKRIKFIERKKPENYKLIR